MSHLLNFFADLRVFFFEAREGRRRNALIQDRLGLTTRRLAFGRRRLFLAIEHFFLHHFRCRERIALRIHGHVVRR